MREGEPRFGAVPDARLNQGSRAPFLHLPDDDSYDHNDVWQDGAVMINRGDVGWAAYFAMFTRQTLDTDKLGNLVEG